MDPLIVLKRASVSVGSNPTAELRYHLQGFADESSARIALQLAVPTTYTIDSGTLYLDTLNVDEDRGGVFEGIVRYANVSPIGTTIWSFDTTGGTAHRDMALAHISAATRGPWTPFDFGGAINVTEAGVEGVDVVSPVLNWQETRVVPVASMTDTYIGTLFALTGTVNSAAFRMFAAGECLFLGASANNRGDGYVELTFRFSCQPNATNLKIAEGTDYEITVASKKGWEYLWVSFRDEIVAGALGKITVKRPQLASVERVYPDGDFSLLGI